MKKLITLLSIPIIAATVNSCRDINYDSNKDESKEMEVKYTMPIIKRDPFYFGAEDSAWNSMTQEQRDSTFKELMKGVKAVIEDNHPLYVRTKPII